MRTLGILLAGGRGTRLGAGVPKALVTLGGVTLLERGLATLRACCDDVVVTAPVDMVLPEHSADERRDIVGVEGPLSGILAGMSSVEPFGRALVLAVDMPFVRAEALQAIGDRLGDAIAILPAPRGRVQPLAAWYAGAAYPSLLGTMAAGGRSIVSAALALFPEIVHDAVLATLPGGLEQFFNLNTPADLQEAARRMAQEGAA